MNEPHKLLFEGITLGLEGKYDEAIEKFKKAIELDPNYKEVYYNWGVALSAMAELADGDKRQELYRRAIDKFKKAIKLDSNDNAAYYNWGVALLTLARLEAVDKKQELYRRAIEKFKKVIKLDSNDNAAYHKCGNALSNLAELASGDKRQGLYHEAIVKYVKAIELEPNYKETYYNWGNVLYTLAGLESGDKRQVLYRTANDKYAQVIDLDPAYKDAYNNWGTSLLALAGLAGCDKRQGLYREAIVKFKKAIKLDPNYTAAYHNWGSALSALARLASGDKKQELYREAIEKYDMVESSDPDYCTTQRNKGLTLYESGGTAKDIATCFSNAGLKIFDILSIGEKPDGKTDLKLMGETLNYMLDTDFNDKSPIEFFTQLLKEYKIDYSTELKSEFQQLKDIYIQSLLIISLLHVEKEDNVAHYTSISTAKLMLFKNKDEGRAEPSQLRMFSATMTNDPKEGITLLDFLGIETTKDKSKEKQAAFVGCFSFNHNNLTQFRLYGNKDNVEGTGLSIVVQNNFFSPSMTDCLNSETDTKENRCALYRCIYLDPDVEQIISLGHRDEYAFYLSKCTEKEIEDYNKAINDKLKAVRTSFSTLKELISKYKGDHAILTPLLLQLRYLTKHAAFKEEQECRILDIENIAGENDKVKYDDRINKMYINYAQIEKRHLCCIYFAPKAADYTLFCNRLKINGIECPCTKSEHPLA